MTVRWIFTDTDTDDTVTLPINPNKMSSPTLARDTSFGWTSPGNIALLDRGQSGPTSWTFGGVILTKAHYDLLLAWVQRSVVLTVEDHLGRVFEVLLENFDPVERYPSRTRAWRADYTMTCLLLREVP